MVKKSVKSAKAAKSKPAKSKAAKSKSAKSVSAKSVPAKKVTKAREKGNFVDELRSAARASAAKRMKKLGF